MATATKVNVKREDAVSLLVELGLKNSDKLDNAALTKRVQGLPKIVDDETQPSSDKGKKTLNMLLAAVKDKDEIEIVGADESAPASAPAKGKKTGKSKPTAKDKSSGKKTSSDKDKKSASNGANVDGFGSRVGSNTAKFNAILPPPGKKGLKMSELVEKAKLEGTFYTHAAALIESGLVKKADGLYTLTEKGAKALAKK